MNSKDVERYIMIGYQYIAPKKKHTNRSVEKIILFNGHKCCLIALTIWLLLSFVMPSGSDPISMLPINITLLLLIPIIILLDIKLTRMGLKRATAVRSQAKHYPLSPLLTSICASAGVMGMYIARIFLSNASPKTSAIIVCVIGIILQRNLK